MSLIACDSRAIVGTRHNLGGSFGRRADDDVSLHGCGHARDWHRPHGRAQGDRRGGGTSSAFHQTPQHVDDGSRKLLACRGRSPRPRGTDPAVGQTPHDQGDRMGRAALVVESLEHLGLGYWLAGGWGVDALVQRQTGATRTSTSSSRTSSATNPRCVKPSWPSASTTSRWTRAASGCHGDRISRIAPAIASNCSPSTGRT